MDFVFRHRDAAKTSQATLQTATRGNYVMIIIQSLLQMYIIIIN